MTENTLTPGAYTLPNDCKAFVRPRDAACEKYEPKNEKTSEKEE